jgi:hypothetical protein
VIDVEQHALRAFEQDAASARPRLVQRQPDRPREGQHEPGNLAQVRLQRLAIDRRFPEARAQRVVMRAQAIELRIELVDMGEVADADRAAADLVLISRADAAPGGADLALARRVLAQPVEIAVDRRIKGQVSATRSTSGSTLTPWPRSRSTSSRRAQGSSTTPLPMIDRVPVTMPLGSSDNL